MLCSLAFVGPFQPLVPCIPLLAAPTLFPIPGPPLSAPRTSSLHQEEPEALLERMQAQGWMGCILSTTPFIAPCTSGGARDPAGADAGPGLEGAHPLDGLVVPQVRSGTLQPGADCGTEAAGGP